MKRIMYASATILVCTLLLILVFKPSANQASNPLTTIEPASEMGSIQNSRPIVEPISEPIAESTTETTTELSLQQNAASNRELDDKPSNQPVNAYFFNNKDEEITYNGFFLVYEDCKVETTLSIKKVLSTKNGTLYEITIKPSDFPGLEVLREDRLNGFYFYVTKDKIYKIWRLEENLEKIKNGDIPEHSRIVCQEEEVVDPLDKDEKGWHEYIIIKDGIIEFHSYNSKPDTGYYETMFWGKDSGLIFYQSGFGAMSEHIELTLKK